MNKAQLVDAIAAQNGMTKTVVEETLNMALEIIKTTVRSGEDVTLVGFGTFTRGARQERAGRNPQTGEEMRIPAMVLPRFRPGKEFKEALR